jgi:hypothetical protein
MTLSFHATGQDSLRGWLSRDICFRPTVVTRVRFPQCGNGFDSASGIAEQSDDASGQANRRTPGN